MKYIHRLLEVQLHKAIHSFPALLLTGARRTGKTTLLRKCFPHAEYYLLEDPDIIGRFREDPRDFIEGIKTPVILDEVQNVPEIINYVRTKIDKHPNKTGQWLLTGSQESSLMKGVTESMAGRVAILTLLPMSIEESERVNIISGGFPEILSKPSASSLWFQSYIQTYLERDVRQISGIRDLSMFRRFLSLIAAKVGTILNRTDFSASLGVSVPTISQWLSILEITQQILLIPPFYENFGKRLIKSPRIYLSDTGILCHLLGISNLNELKRSPFAGKIFENFIAAEIIKKQINIGKRKDLYYFRDRQGLEIDFLIQLKSRKLLMVEAKFGKTVYAQSGKPLATLHSLIKNYETKSFIVYRPDKELEKLETVIKGVKAVTLETLLKEIV